MKYPKIIISFSFFLFSFLCCKAQENDQQKYIYQDSSVKIKDTLYTKPDEVVSTDSSTQNSEEAQPDSILQPNNLSLSADSIADLKNSRSFLYAKNLDSLLKKWQKDHEVKIDTTEKGPGLLDNFFASGITKGVLWLLAVLFILFILYKLFFTRGAFQKNITRSNVNEIPQDENATGNSNYDQLITQAVSNKNFRLAIRYLYLLSLQKLAGKNLVQLAVDKTNYQYATELNNTIYKDDFLGLTLNYEYVWYGEFELDDVTFAQLQNKFNQFNNRV
jgi:hypothetical protein